MAGHRRTRPGGIRFDGWNGRGSSRCRDALTHQYAQHRLQQDRLDRHRPGALRSRGADNIGLCLPRRLCSEESMLGVLFTLVNPVLYTRVAYLVPTSTSLAEFFTRGYSSFGYHCWEEFMY